MKKWISYPHLEGETSRQAHCDLPPGTYEREVGKAGFYGPATHFYHRHPPTGWSDFQGPLRPRAFDANALRCADHSPWSAVALLSNPYCRIRYWETARATDHLVRNADGDELLFVHEGGGELFCDYGHLSYRDGDYMLLPRGTLWRLQPASPTRLLLIEATGDSYRLPDKGLLGTHAIFDPALLEVPHIDAAFKAQRSETSWRVVVKRRQQFSTITYPFNPLDAVGWAGDLCAARINWRDIRPLMSHRYHLPPSAHTTLLARRFVVCTFCPRPLETDPGALKVPFYHSNDDFEEVIFYHRGEFVSRDNIHPGMITLHPFGCTHGPHPGAFKKGAEHARAATDEVAVMVDARDAFEIDAAASAVEWPGYVASWSGMAAARE
jgi:homogentisate 1,2-dioxygenase